MWLFLAFLAVPLIEIALFIQIGGLIGLFPTLIIVVLTAILGTWLVRSQGLAEMGRLQRSFVDLRDPTTPLAHGAMILFSGALLLTPGFFTDAVGFALLIPGVRDWLLSQVKRRINVQTVQFGQAPGRQRPDDIIDGEYTVEPQEGSSQRSGPSGWTRD